MAWEVAAHCPPSTIAVTGAQKQRPRQHAAPFSSSCWGVVIEGALVLCVVWLTSRAACFLLLAQVEGGGSGSTLGELLHDMEHTHERLCALLSDAAAMAGGTAGDDETAK